MHLPHLGAKAGLLFARSPQLFLEVLDLSLLSRFVLSHLDHSGTRRRLSLRRFETLQLLLAAFEFFAQLTGFAPLGLELLVYVVIRIRGVAVLDVLNR